MLIFVVYSYYMSQKYDLIAAEEAYGKFLEALGFNWKQNPHMEDTPRRVAKAWVHDLARGCFENEPKITAFENDGQYDGMVCQTNIPVISMCAHHNLPFMGYAHVAYIPSPDGKVIGLSKLNRIVDYICRRPQVQETLNMQVHKFIDEVCEGNKGVAVMVEANHTCCSLRGIKQNSSMRTARMSGAFHEPGDGSRNEFYKFIEFAQNSRGLI
jgi:GTP cyclohydrolase I